MKEIIQCKIDEIHTESDVEQKFIIPLLINSAPLGLDYCMSDFKTKHDIRKLKIDKGDSSKYYFPDYAIIHAGLPLMIIEAKKPGEDLKEAYREARLYANEINAQFPHKINPCQRIIVTDARTTIAGNWDSDNVLFKIDFGEVNSVDSNFYEFVKFVCKQCVFRLGDIILSTIRGNTHFSRPLSLLGGKTIQNEELKPNGFGATLSLEFKYLFNPESFEERKNIVKNAYVKTRRLLKQVDPIERAIRATIPIGSREITKIEDSAAPVEILNKFIDSKKLKNQLLLLIGNVGSGKSTFTDYLREVALTSKTKEETIWVSVNLNLAVLNREEIYKWLKEQIISKLEDLHPEIDFDDAGVLQRIYSVEFLTLRKGPASFFEKGSLEYNKLFSEKLSQLQNTLDLKCNAYIRYLCAERAKLLVVVLDNADKRNLEDQLLMFDVANWLKVTYNCLVFLPLRDTTFDNFRKTPPLDTVIKDLVFRIDPPLLREVISERIKFALREMTQSKTKLSFTLPNGMIVEYPHTDQGYYLASIVRSLFESVYFSRLITGLAGRDIRRGLEIFLDFCKSGHINEAEIFKIRQSKGEHLLQNHLISRVIIRGNRKYYSDSGSLVKNLFTSIPDDVQPNPFVRLQILKWLKENFKKQGPSRVVGYHKISSLFNELISYGNSKVRLNAEVLNLIQNRCVITESQSEEIFSDDDLIAITPSGIIHLELLNDINYIAACAEDVWYREFQPAEDIQKRITDKIGPGHYAKETSVINSTSLVEYLEEYTKRFLLIKPEIYLESDKIFDYINLNRLKVIIEKTAETIEDTYKMAITKYPIGSEHDGEVASVQPYGAFIEFGLNAKGILHNSNLEYGKKISDFEEGDVVKIVIKGYKTEHHRFDLVLSKGNE